MKVLKCLVSVAKNFDIFIVYTVITRGRVEDTRLEAKDTKKSEAKQSLSKDRHSRRQGQECSRPMTKDTSASALQKKKKDHKNLSGDLQNDDKNFSGDLQKKKVFTKIFQETSTKKNVFQKIFQALFIILTIQKIVLSLSQGQADFRGLEASRPRTSSRTPPLVITNINQIMFAAP